MARRWYLVSCVSQKRSRPLPARDLYCSDWFVKARAYVEAQSCPWFILSAKHGLVQPDQVIAPYNETLNEMPNSERRAWAARVADDLRHVLHPGDEVNLLAGQTYREHLAPMIRDMGCPTNVPMEGLGIGQQKGWLKRQIEVLRRSREKDS